ncbi:DUF6204 family protein [Streptomyces sp. NPDC059456]|uniref:DUF6204 family protein n=1 Tax=Streptomyces sp. NPDC059456 TaxID=3346838 RepID=UPI00369C7954
MSTRTFRITVRGSFDALTADQRAGLLAAAPEHDILHAVFTTEGHLTYDVTPGPFFTFRFLDSGETEEDVLDATARAGHDPGGNGPGGRRGARMAAQRTATP